MLIKSLDTRNHEMLVAKHLAKTLGIRCAAGYLRNRNWSVEAASYIILGA